MAQTAEGPPTPPTQGRETAATNREPRGEGHSPPGAGGRGGLAEQRGNRPTDGRRRTLGVEGSEPFTADGGRAAAVTGAAEAGATQGASEPAQAAQAEETATAIPSQRARGGGQHEARGHPARVNWNGMAAPPGQGREPKTAVRRARVTSEKRAGRGSTRIPEASVPRLE